MRVLPSTPPGYEACTNKILAVGRVDEGVRLLGSAPTEGGGAEDSADEVEGVGEEVEENVKHVDTFRLRNVDVLNAHRRDTQRAVRESNPEL